MAVRNEWADASVQAGKKGNPANVSGARKKGFVITFAIAAADTDASIIKLVKLPANAILTKLDPFASWPTSLDMLVTLAVRAGRRVRVELAPA